MIEDRPFKLVMRRAYRSLLTRQAPRPRRKRPEDQLQRSVCQYWSLQWPDTWAMTFHVPNGLHARSPVLAAIFVGLGMKKGVLDLLCIARRGPFNGFALELKGPDGRISKEQREWLDAFTAQGWDARVAWDFDQAAAFVREYHSLPAREPLYASD